MGQLARHFKGDYQAGAVWKEGKEGLGGTQRGGIGGKLSGIIARSSRGQT